MKNGELAAIELRLKEFAAFYSRNNRQISDTLRSFQETAKPIADAMRLMEGNLRPTIEAMRLLDVNLKPARDAIRLIESNVKPISDVMKHLAEGIRLVEIEKRFKELIESWNEVNRICFELGWFPHDQWGPEAGRTILRLYREKKYEQLDSEICEFYANEIVEDFVTAWKSKKSINNNRLIILEEAINAHLNQSYSVASIAFLSQIEGCIRDVLKNYNKVNHKKLMKKFKESLIKSSASSYNQTLKIEQVFDLIINKIFGHHGYNKKTGQIKFSRHSVLHGFYLGNFDKNKSCKLILLLNFIITNEVFIRGIDRKVLQRED